ncbi:hypothetical protein AB4162_00340 [Vibrio sp. 10N.286.52.B1]|uniref:hypothetical protein n=1 Tax=Vibrio sp. 10N.286.52.B1 TaxID=3229712 RepID=UPI00354F7178
MMKSLLCLALCAVGTLAYASDDVCQVIEGVPVDKIAEKLPDQDIRKQCGMFYIIKRESSGRVEIYDMTQAPHQLAFRIYP